MKWIVFIISVFFIVLACDRFKGNNGKDGTNGHNAVFTNVPNSPACVNGGHTIITALDVNDNGVFDNHDTNVQSFDVCNGENGNDASYSVVEPITPCGPTVNYKEVLLLLANGQILSSFSDNVQGMNTRLAFLPDGTFMDTDGSNCIFIISTNGHTRSISWNTSYLGGGLTWELH